MEERFTVLDTNYIIEDPSSVEFPQTLDNFSSCGEGVKNTILVPTQVILELDKFKGEKDTRRGKNATNALRRIKELKQNNGGGLYEGIPLGENLYLMSSRQLEEQGIEDDPAVKGHDEGILNVPNHLKKQGLDVTLMTNDTGVYDIADSLGIEVRTLEKYETDESDPYKGWRFVEVGRQTYKRFEENKKLDPEDLNLEDLMPNEFVIFHGHQFPPTPSIYKPDDGMLHWLFHYDERLLGDSGIKAKNPAQQCYMHALRDPDIDLVIALGKAGTAKTFLAADSGIELCLSHYGYDGRMRELKNRNEKYQHIINSKRDDNGTVYSTLLLTRPVIETNTGYLPGPLEEKMQPWLAPVEDQFEQLWNMYGISQESVKEARNNGELGVLPFDFMRGRSVHNTFWVVDESQNVYHADLLTALTRSGENAKMVITGDPSQCDLKGVSAVSNPVEYLNDKFRTSSLAATIMFDKPEHCVRSELARDALYRLGNGR